MVKPSIIQKTIPKINYEEEFSISKRKIKKLSQKNEQLLLDGAHSKTNFKIYDYLKETKLPLYCVWAMQKQISKEFLKEFKGIFKKFLLLKFR